MDQKSLFVVIEGLDGSGKSTVAGHLGKAMAKEDIEVRMTFEPNDDSCGGEWIRDVLKKKIAPVSPKTLALAFAANRLDHCDRKIDPWLNSSNNRILISDRYYLSSLVYQQAKDISIEDLMSLNSAPSASADCSSMSTEMTMFLGRKPRALSKSAAVDQ